MSYNSFEEVMASKKKSPLDTRLSSLRKFKGQSGRFGVEIELEGSNLQATLEHWTMHSDGSLREGGVEFVLIQPLSRQTLGEAMRLLESTMRQADRRVSLSLRASTHIHMNMQQESIRTILYTVALFAILDPLVCRISGAARDGNLFCLNNYDSGNLPSTVETMTCLSMSKDISAFPQRGKYASINMNPLMNFGSLEFRMFPPTITTKDVLTWTLWLENVLELARNTKSDRELREHINLARTNPGVIIDAVFNKSLEITPFEAHNLIQLGCETAYEVYRGIVAGQTAESQIKNLGKVYHEA